MNSGIRPFGLIVLTLAATLGASWAIDSRPPEALAQPLNTIPATVGDWRGTEDPAMRSDILAALDATSYLSRTYRRGSESVNLFIAYYANQKAGESMHSPKHCLPGSGWEFLSFGETDVPLAGGTVRVNQDLIQKDGARMALIYWYQSRRRVIASELGAKLYLIRDAVMERRTGGAIVRVICPYESGGAATGRDFVAAAFPEIWRAWGGEAEPAR
jgi:EpsI family protein